MELEEVRNHLTMVLATNAYINICKSTDLVIAIEAIDKQIPKNPVQEHYVIENVVTHKMIPSFREVCPNCGSDYIKDDYGMIYSHCADCGQAIDWGE